MNKKIVLTVIPLLLLAIFVFADTDTGNLEITPDEALNLTLNPGLNSNIGTFTINNTSPDEDLSNIHISVIDLPTDWEETWFVFSNNDFNLSINSTEDITFDVDLLSTVSPGNYTATINAEADGDNSDTLQQLRTAT